MISQELLVLVLINTIFFFVLLIKNLVSSEKDKYEQIKNAELAIFAIAFSQYGLTFIIENSNVLEKDSQLFAQQLRYFDWLITTPLLLFTYWKLAEVEGYEGDFFILFAMDLVMIIAGMIAEIFITDKNIKLLLYLIGVVAYGIIFWKVLQIMNFFTDKGMKKEKNLGFFFLIFWNIYPLAFFLNDNAKFVIYSIGDFINKGIYSIYLGNIINE
jgi:bacteriorhodopsin